MTLFSRSPLAQRWTGMANCQIRDRRTGITSLRRDISTTNGHTHPVPSSGYRCDLVNWGAVGPAATSRRAVAETSLDRFWWRQHHEPALDRAHRRDSWRMKDDDYMAGPSPVHLRCRDLMTTHRKPALHLHPHRCQGCGFWAPMVTLFPHRSQAGAGD